MSCNLLNIMHMLPFILPALSVMSMILLRPLSPEAYFLISEYAKHHRCFPKCKIYIATRCALSICLIKCENILVTLLEVNIWVLHSIALLIPGIQIKAS